MTTKKRIALHVALGVVLGWSIQVAALTSIRAQDISPPPLPGVPSPDAPRGKSWALLVGCTNYPSLPNRRQLQGPLNDVRLLRQTLTGSPYRFPEKNIRSLTDDPSDQGLPTLANIREGFEWLVSNAGSDDQIVVLLAGHGSQQPANADPDGEDHEPDDLDEVFLPRDIGAWKLQTACIDNALVDDEIYRFSRAIRARGAHLWMILDCCHSGSGIRGDEGITAREVSAEELGVPKEKQHRRDFKAKVTKRGSLMRPTPEGPFDAGRESGQSPGKLVAFYAAQPDEVEYELPLPPGNVEKERYGMLTFALCQLLQRPRGKPINYAQLGRELFRQYEAWGQESPTPYFEGTDLATTVLGATVAISVPILLERTIEDDYRIDAGRLRGLTAGSILAVNLPETDPSRDKLLGYVVVKSASIAESRVIPCDYRQISANHDLPSKAECRVVFRDFGDARLKLAVDVRGSTESLRQRLEAIQAALREAESELSPFVIVDSLASAQWVVQPRGDALKLLSVQAALLEDDAPLPPNATAIPLDAAAPVEQIVRQMSRIFRARNLIALAGQLAEAGEREAGLKLKGEMLRCTDRRDRVGVPIAAGGPISRLKPDEWVAWRVVNEDDCEVDIAMFHVNSRWEIFPVFPSARDTGVNNRLAKGEQSPVQPVRVTGDPLGREHLVVVAIQALGPQQTFAFLADPNLEEAERAEAQQRGSGGNFWKTSLGRLMRTSLYRAPRADEATARGSELLELEGRRAGLVTFSWDVSLDGNPQP